MAKRINYSQEQKKLQDGKKKVYCGECRIFQRDTEGPSRSIETGEYFMGVCLKGLRPDGMRKVFANKPRECEYYN